MEPETDVIRQVYCEDGNYITIRPWADAPDSAVSMQTVGKKNQEYFGLFEVAMSPKMAKELGRSLIVCAEEIEKR